MFVYTRQLAEDLKLSLGDASSTEIEIPSKPEIPLTPTLEGDNTDAACFIYEEQEDSVRITGLSEEGKNRGVLTIPTTYNGKAITAFDVTVFSENIRITQVTIQSNVQILYNGSFNGCNRLQKIVLKHTSPNTIGVGVNLLQGAENCYIYVPNTVLDIFATHYNWGAYRNVLRGY
jgi:hypothetical protein